MEKFDQFVAAAAKFRSNNIINRCNKIALEQIQQNKKWQYLYGVKIPSSTKSPFFFLFFKIKTNIEKNFYFTTVIENILEEKTKQLFKQFIWMFSGC